MKDTTLKVNNKPVDFTYTNELTPIEHLFLKNYFDSGNYESLVFYLEDCVLWKRQNYFDPLKKSRANGFNKEED